MSFGSIASGIGSALSGAAAVGTMMGVGAPRNKDVGIRRAVADAKIAGIHPLAALGASIPGGFAGAGSQLLSGLDDLGRSISSGGAQAQAADAANREAERLDLETKSRIKVNETQAMLNEARSRSMLAELQANPTITRELLDPSFGTDPTGRLAWFMDARGKYNRVNRSVAPAEVLEKEYGEASEIHNAARAIQGMYGYKGWEGESPSIEEIVNALRSMFSNP